jgi:serine/threonine protein kinase
MDKALENLLGKKASATGSDKVSIESFSLLTFIGKGSYADVILARKKDTQKIYALKVLKKKKIEAKNQKNHVSTERNILVTKFLTILTLD